MQKPSIFGHLGQKGPFWTVFGQNGQNGENYQKSAWNIFFSPLQALTNCKVSEKVMSVFRKKRCERTDVRTYATPKVSTTSGSRDQKVGKTSFLSLFKKIMRDSRRLKIFQTISKLPMHRYYLD